MVLALVAWAIVRTLQADSAAAAGHAGRATPRANAANGEPRAAPAPALAPEVPAVPSLIEEDDRVEITVVEAAPLSDTEADAETVRRRAPETSTVAVTYEDEADHEEKTLPVARILVSAQGSSDRGNVRRRNEDSLLVYPDRAVFCVADGMGGYAGGHVASALAVETLRASFELGHFDAKTQSEVDVPRRGRELACAIQMANHAIFARARSEPGLAQMGTTVVAARFSPSKQRVYIGHVGDSRCYRLRQGALRQLTRDHTMAEFAGLKGPGGQHLFQAVGVKADILIDLVVDKPRMSDVYLLCSDGLSKMISDKEILGILLSDPNLDSAVQTLIDLAKDHGGKDNVTVILVKVVEPVPDAGRVPKVVD
jgi:serine/threonine protein phosphatase PrpC